MTCGCFRWACGHDIDGVKMKVAQSRDDDGKRKNGRCRQETREHARKWRTLFVHRGALFAPPQWYMYGTILISTAATL